MLGICLYITAIISNTNGLERQYANAEMKLRDDRCSGIKANQIERFSVQLSLWTGNNPKECFTVNYISLLLMVCLNTSPKCKYTIIYTG